MDEMIDKYNKNDEEINLKDLLEIILHRKLTILLITTSAAFLSLIFSLSLPDIYSSRTILAPTNEEESLNSKLGGLSSLSFVGVRIPGESATKSQEAIERIKSFEFFSKHFLPNIQLENIMAVKKWKNDSNELIYKIDLFDKNNDEWVLKPSIQEAYEVYIDHINIDEDQKTSFVTISISHQSPYIAQKWINIIVDQINENMRKVDAELAKKSISYLSEAYERTKIESIKNAISQLLEGQMQTLMLTASNNDYVYKTIDSPIVPEKKTEPSRAVICIIGTIVGGILSLFIAFFLSYRDQSNN